MLQVYCWKLSDEKWHKIHSPTVPGGKSNWVITSLVNVMKKCQFYFSTSNVDGIFEINKIEWRKNISFFTRWTTLWKRYIFLSSYHINKSSGFWLKCCSRFLKFDPFDEWLSQTIALTLKPGWNKILRQTISSSLSQSAWFLVSGDDLITYGIVFL